MKRTVVAAVALFLAACSDSTQTVPFDRAVAQARGPAAALRTTAASYPAPAPCSGHELLEFAVAFAKGGTSAYFNGTNTITYDGSPTQSQAYVTVTACHGVLASVSTTSWGWRTSVVDPAEDCPGLALVPPTKNYIDATAAPASCRPAGVMDSIRSDGEVDNASGIGASLLIAPNRVTAAANGSHPYLDGFAGITSFGGSSEASGAWRVAALDANGDPIGERTFYEIASP